MIKITALIITYNEAENIGVCIDSVRPVADEILVIDSFSTDTTTPIAEAKGATVICKSFAGFGQQKNEGAAQAAYDYILSIDADERLSKELIDSMLRIKAEKMLAPAYSFNRLNHLAAQPIRVCGWYPDISTRLYHRKSAQWTAAAVHEQLVVNGTTEWIEGDLLHYSFDDFISIRDKFERYSRLAAVAYKADGQAVNIVKMFISPLFKFAKAYLLQRGFTAGYMGFRISYEQARGSFLKYYWAIR